MNLRVIKKDIDYMVNDFIEDCLMFAMVHQDKEIEKIEELINEADELAVSLIKKVNNPEKGAKSLKPYYNAIVKELYSGLDALCSKLSELAK